MSLTKVMICIWLYFISESYKKNGAKLSSPPQYIFLMLRADKSFDDEESVDGNRPSSAASAFKVPAPKTSGNPVNSARKPGSAGGPKVGGNVNPFPKGRACCMPEMATQPWNLEENVYS